MTPIGHSACGLAAGGVLAPVIKKIFRTPYRAQYTIFLISAIIPDLDALSLLTSHAVYYGKFWYSHHMFFHSIVAAAVVSFFIALVYITGATAARGTRNLFRKEKIVLENRILKFTGAFLAGFSGYLIHLLGDLPTPPGPWNGIALMWPSAQMSGGWGKIYWHNWYLIYMAVLFIIAFAAATIPAGILSYFKNRYIKWVSSGFRIMSVIFSLIFIFKTVSFIQTNDYNKMGFAKYDALNRSMVPQKYIKNADEYLNKATVFWRKNLLSQEKLIETGNKLLYGLEKIHALYSPAIALLVPSGPSPESDMRLYRKLQSIAPGMEDSRCGDYRTWIVRDSYPNPEYFNRGFLLYYNETRKRFYLQMTNAWMTVFKIIERDKNGNATSVKKIYQTNKIFVPDRDWPQLNSDEIKHLGINFWNHDRIAYNIIPRRAISRFRNIVHGFYPSLNDVPGFIHPGRKTGIAIHDGPYSEGCTVHAYLHLDIASHLENPFYPLWHSADKVIDINKMGTNYRGREKFWGRVIYFRDPEIIKSTDIAKK